MLLLSIFYYYKKLKIHIIANLIYNSLLYIMDNLTKLMDKLSINNKIDDKEVNVLENLLKNMSLNETDDSVSNVIDQMKSLKIEEGNELGVSMEIIMNDNTKIQIFVPCYIQFRTPIETMDVIDCF